MESGIFVSPTDRHYDDDDDDERSTYWSSGERKAATIFLHYLLLHTIGRIQDGCNNNYFVAYKKVAGQK